jgi:mRNA interferase MazF
VVHYPPSLSFFEIDLTILQREVLKQRKFSTNIVIRRAASRREGRRLKRKDWAAGVVQSNEFNESAIRTSICAAMTSNMRLADAPGNVRVTRRASGLSRESVVNVSQLITLDKQRLTEKVGRLPAESLRDVEAGIRLVLAL